MRYIMKKNRTSRSSLFLIELIISIFFFIIAAAICIQLFIKSHIISQETVAIDHAIVWTQNLSEIFINEDGNFSKVQNYFLSQNNMYTELFSDSECMLFLYDNNWHPVNYNEFPAYIVFSYPTSDSNFNYENIYITKCSNELTDYLEQICSSDNRTSYINDFIDNYISKQYCINHCQVKKYIQGKHI